MPQRDCRPQPDLRWPVIDFDQRLGDAECRSTLVIDSCTMRCAAASTTNGTAEHPWPGRLRRTTGTTVTCSPLSAAVETTRSRSANPPTGPATGAGHRRLPSTGRVPQHADGAAEVGQRRGADLPDTPQRRGRVVGFVGQRLEPDDALDRDRRYRVGEHIVDLPGDPQPLLFDLLAGVPLVVDPGPFGAQPGLPADFPAGANTVAKGDHRDQQHQVLRRLETEQLGERLLLHPVQGGDDHDDARRRRSPAATGPVPPRNRRRRQSARTPPPPDSRSCSRRRAGPWWRSAHRPASAA